MRPREKTRHERGEAVSESEVTTEALLSDGLCIWPSAMASRAGSGGWLRGGVEGIHGMRAEARFPWKSMVGAPGCEL